MLNTRNRRGSVEFRKTNSDFFVGYNKTIIQARRFPKSQLLGLVSHIRLGCASPDMTSPRPITEISETASPDNCLLSSQRGFKFSLYENNIKWTTMLYSQLGYLDANVKRLW